MSSHSMRKKCSRCREWKPLNNQNYSHYIRKQNNNETLQWKSMCKPCARQYYKDNVSKWKVRTTKDLPEDKKRKRLLTQEARYAARAKLAQVYEKEFDRMYSEELAKRGVKLQYYRRINNGKQLIP